MPTFIVILTLTVGLALLIYRNLKFLSGADDQKGIPKIARPAAHRFDFTYDPKQHPISQTNSESIALATLTAAFITADGSPTEAQLHSARQELQSALGFNLTDSTELLVLGRWLATKCGDSKLAVPQLMRRLCELSGPDSVDLVAQVFQGIVACGNQPITSRQSEILGEVKCTNPGNEGREIVTPDKGKSA